MTQLYPRFLLLVLCAFVVNSTDAAEPWATFRGNPQRTGNTDGKAGPAKADVLWAHKANDHFVASPVPSGDRLFVSGFSGFNIPSLYALDTAPQAKERVAWTKSIPVLKFPTVSSPAFADGKMVFGDGMHQTDGAVLRCVQADTGRMVWQLEVPGDLVHMEGAPAVEGKKVYAVGGAAGVICVDLDRVTMDGKETTLAAARKIQDEKWAQLQAKYEADKKKGDLFAMPPSEDQLPKVSPVKHWQQGEKKWHVDAPVNVVGDRVLAASSFLDKEKVGDRALYCLDAATGKEQWRAALQYNPWSGASVQGETVVIAGSSISYDPTLLKGAKGEIVALELATGKEKWRKTVPAGVLASVALTPELAVAAATDGKLRAFDLNTGERATWIYDAKAPLFAAPAVVGGVAYVADLGGVLHAVDLSTGAAKWTLDLGKHPAVQSPGMVYGGPVVHGGRVYLATCNLAGTHANKPTVVVCIGEK